MASRTRWMWVRVNSGSWWWTGRPGVLRSVGSQRVGHDWMTELNWTDIIFVIDLSPPLNYSPSGWGKTPFLSCLPSLLELLEFSHLVTSAERHPRTSPPACCTPALGTHWLLPSCLPNGLPWPSTVTEMCLSLGPVCPLSYCPHQAWLLCWLSFTQSPCQWAPSMPGLRESGMS